MHTVSFAHRVHFFIQEFQLLFYCIYDIVLLLGFEPKFSGATVHLIFVMGVLPWERLNYC